jgi:protein-disulfide isomerase
VIRILLSFVLATSLFVVAQQTLSTNEINRRIERQVRAYAEAPMDAKITLGTRSASNFAGYDKLPVDIEANGAKKTFNFLVAKDGSKLLYVHEFDLSEDPYARVMKKIDVRDRPIRGAQDAKVTVVIYDDYQCPFCGRFYATFMNEVMTKYRDRARVIIKDFPIVDIHPWALHAAVDSTCVAQNSTNAYWQFSDYVHTHQQEFNSNLKTGELDKTFSALDDLALKTAERNGVAAGKLQACLSAQNRATVEASIAEGKSLGIGGTPTLFVNGQEFEGVLTPEQIDAALDRALREAQ